MNNKEWKKWLFWFSFAVAAIVVYKTIDSVSSIISSIGSFFKLIMPFFMAILVAYILYMPCKGIEKVIKKIKFKIFNKHARGLSVLLVYVIAVFIIINFIIPTVKESIVDLVENLPNYYNSAIEFVDNADEDSIITKLNVKQYISNLNSVDFGQEIINWISMDNISSYIKGIVGAANVIFDMFVTIVVSIYILLERADIKSFFENLSKAIFDKKTNMAIARYYRKTNSIFFNFIASQLIDALVVGIITSIAMSIMKIKYAVLLGFMIGLFNIIPYFGAIVAVILAILITVFTGGIAQAIWLGIVVIVLQQIDANIINPKILGNSLNLSPILVIFAVTVGGAYFGVLGMFLGVPVIAFLKIIIDDFISYRNQSGFLEKIHLK